MHYCLSLVFRLLRAGTQWGTQRVPAILMGYAHTPLGLAILSPAVRASGMTRNDEENIYF